MRDENRKAIGNIVSDSVTGSVALFILLRENKGRKLLGKTISRFVGGGQPYASVVSGCILNPLCSL